MNIELYTDGACSGNPGPGGWGAILRYGDHERELSGGEHQTTNNRMELRAVIEGLKAIKAPHAVIDVFSDSKYVVDAFRKQWLKKWLSMQWKNSKGEPVKNRDLWEQMAALVEVHQVTFHWVEGHSGHPENERCDALARSAIPASI